MIFRSVSNTDFRARVRTLLLAGSTALAFVAAPVWAFSIDDVASKAKDLAGDKYSAPTSNLPSEFSEMKFADYQQIRFINERAYWGKLKTPFKLSFYHQGMHFDTPVKINEVTATTVKPIKYDRTKFDFGSLKFDENATKDLGYAGFRVLYPINKADKQDEIATFLGARYFLTSMYLFGSNQPSEQHNFRPELHDSSGLQIHAGNGEWLWRPLNNPKHLSVSTFSVENPKGFGLLQRGREFSRYEDLDDRYDLRPSAWIEPKGDWGKGTVELVEIPTPDETNDNIVAFWNPETQPEVGKPLDFAYRLHWTMDEDELHDPKSSWVKQTMRSVGDVKQKNLIRQQDGSTALVVDFEGPALKDLAPDAPVTTQVSTDSNAEVVENSLRYNPVLKGWRLTLRIKVKDPKKPVEMRAALVDEAQKPLSETWSYQLPADE